MITNIPEGTKDYLFEECRVKRGIERALISFFEEQDYNEIITPTFEFYEAFASQKIFADEEMYKLIDTAGRILVLRPDCTTPVARLLGTLLRDSKMPLKLCYNQNIFRLNNSAGGKKDEITQCGVELIGENGIKSDIEIIATAINALIKCGLANFKLEIGDVGLFKALAGKINFADGDLKRARTLIENKNFAALKTLLEKYKGSEQLNSLPSLFGGVEIIKTASLKLNNENSQKILGKLEEIMMGLEKLGLSDYVMLDLGLVSHIDYYSGIIFRAYVEGAGRCVLSGGRYDNLLEKFGKPEMAAGFAVNVDAILDIVLKKA